MKFKFYKDHYKSGDKLIFISFLLLPRRCEDGWWRWLERVNVERSFYTTTAFWKEFKLTYEDIYLPLTHDQHFTTKFNNWLK